MCVTDARGQWMSTHATETAYGCIIVLGITLLDHILHDVVVDKERLSISQAHIAVVILLGLFLQAMIAVCSKDNAVDVSESRR